MHKAVFLDRDGTINVDKNYLYRIEDFEFIDGAVQGMRLLQEAGYLLVVITNQSGIARGYYTERDYNRLTEWMLNRLAELGLTIAGVYFCPHFKDGILPRYSVVCGCRKPKTGLFHKAIRELTIDTESSYAIGDRLRDISICFETGVRGIILGRDAEPCCERGVTILPNLLAAAEYIVNRNDKRSGA